MAVQDRAETAVMEAAEWTKNNMTAETVKKWKITSAENKKKRKRGDVAEDRCLEDKLTEDNEVGSGVKKSTQSRKLAWRYGETEQKVRPYRGFQHIWKLPKELRIQIWRYLVAPEEGVRRDFCREPGRSPFNISLCPLRVEKKWQEEIGKVWDQYAFATICYPDSSCDFSMEVLKRVGNLRVEVEFYNNMDFRNVAHNSRFVRACDMISEAYDSRESRSRLRSVNIEFRDVRKGNDKIDPTLLCAGLCQGLQLLRSDVVRTSGLPPGVEEPLKAELLSEKSAMQLPRMIGILLSAWSQLQLSRQRQFLSLTTEQNVCTQKLVDEAVSACTLKDFLDRRQLCVDAMRLDGNELTLKEMIFERDDFGKDGGGDFVGRK